MRACRAARIGALVVALGMSTASGVLAQPAPTVAEAAEAKKHFQVGLKLYAERAYPEALAEFELSYKLGGRGSALKNAAQCRRDLKQFAEAYDEYERVFTQYATQLGVNEAAGVKKAMEELVVLTGTISVTSNEADAEIEIDGKPAGRAPLAKPKRVNLGSHRIHLSKPGFEPLDKEVTITSEQSAVVDARLEPEITTGKVTVREAAGRDVHLFIDGVDKGALPWQGELAPGDHTFEAKGQTLAADRRTVTVVRKERAEIVFDAQATTGHLRVSATPATASIVVDGTARGTGSWDGELPPGDHKVEIVLEGYPRVERMISLQRGQLVSADIPVVAALGGPTGPVYRGFEGRFDFQFELNETGRYQPPKSAPVGTFENSGPAGGGAVALRLGYAFDWWALEWVGIYNINFQVTKYELPSGTMGSSGPPELHIGGGQMAGVFGAVARASTKTETIRLTGSLGPAIAVRNFFFSRDADNYLCPQTSMHCPTFNQNAGYVAPAFVFDAGISLGSTPGAKIFIGATGWVEAAPSLAVGPDTSDPVHVFTRYADAPGDGWKVTHGAEFFVGPVIGVGFGH